MNRAPKFWGLHARPGIGLKVALAAIPFVLLVVLYLVASDIRHTENPSDKLLPSLTQLGQAVDRVAFTEDKRTGHYLLWNDTWASLKRLVSGVVLAAITGLLLGLNLGVFPGFRSLFLSSLTFVSMIPPLAILPILFIVVGLGEPAKIVLIFIGVFPVIARDIYLAVRAIPQEQFTKALTLGAGPLTITYRIIMPQIMPRLLNTVRLALGAAWLFLIAAEAIASTDGLGYRIFLVRRYLAMDVIIPYVLWITLMGFTFDALLRWVNRSIYPWYHADK